MRRSLSVPEYVHPMEWRPCVGLPDYEVSECGDVRRCSAAKHQPGRRLRGIIDADGYIQFAMRDANDAKVHRLAHRLVAEAFIGPPPSPKHEIAHNNGSRINNVPSNLRWALRVENNLDRLKHGTASIGESNGRATITEDDVRYIRRRYREIKVSRGDVSELDRKFSLCRAQIIRIARSQAWSHVE